MVVIAGVAGWFLEDALGQVLYQPQVTAGVVALNLMAGSGAAPQKLFGKGFAFVARGAIALLADSPKDRPPIIPATATAEALCSSARRLIGFKVDSEPGSCSSFMSHPR